MREGVGHAPGRLDLLGGVADYSGALVLQVPTQSRCRVTISVPGDEGPDHMRYLSNTAEGTTVATSLLDEARTGVEPLQRLAQLLDQSAAPSWVGFPLGCVLMFGLETGVELPRRVVVEVNSDVPVSSGVASSAALAVATLRACVDLLHDSGRGIAPTRLAHLAQHVEHEVMGSPCGLMDQLAVVHGRPHSVVPIRCTPDLVFEPISLPEDLAVVGWPTGVEHDNAAGPYARGRTAAFMAAVLAEEVVGRPVEQLTDIGSEELDQVAAAIPAHVTGQAFVDQGRVITDPHAAVDPDTEYPVGAALDFAVREHQRSSEALKLLATGGSAAPTALGRLLLESHQGYGPLGLGSVVADEMVQRLQRVGPAGGIYGARISGGGCGGTVVILLERSAVPSVADLARSVNGQELIRAS